MLRQVPVSSSPDPAPQVAAEAGSKRAPGAYLLHAPRIAEGEALVEALVPPDAERLTFYGDEVPAVRLIELLCTPALTGVPRVALVRHAEAMPRSELKALAEALALYPVREDWLVLWDQSEEGRAVEALKALAGGERPGLVVLEAGTGAGPAAMGRAEAILASLDLTPSARGMVEAVLRRHPDRAEQELGKLALYRGERLDEADVRRLLSADLVEQVDDGAADDGPGADRRRFEVAEAALDGDFARALSLAGQLQRDGVPAAWVWREIGRQAMEAWEVAEELEMRFGPPTRWPPSAWKEVAGRFPGRPPGALRRLAGQARRWGTAGLLRLLQWTAEADHDAKRGGMQPDEALLRLLARMAELLGRAP